MTIMVFRTGARDGLPFDYKTVSGDEYGSALKQGWLAEPPSIAKTGKGVTLTADAMPTREEMEQKAKQLGIRGVHLMKDETLAAKIAERV